MGDIIGLGVYLTGIGIAVAFAIRLYLLLTAAQRHLEAKTEAQLRANRTLSE